MNLIIDIGNTLIKVYYFNNDTLVDKFTLENWEVDFIKTHQFRKAIISSVRENILEISESVKAQTNLYIELSHTTPLPIKVKYETPNTLGKDRIALAVGGNAAFPNKNLLIIDAGTAITYDIVNSHNEYLGGNISPGLSMRFKALHEFTGKLPLLDINEYFTLIGNSTNQAIINGVMNGTIFEIEQFIEKFDRKYKNLKIIFTGGNSKFFDKKLKKTIFVDQNLIGKGLNRILEYNV